MLGICLIIFEQKSASFLIESGFGIGDNQETFDDKQDMLYPHLWLPVLFESAHTDLAVRSNIGMKYFGKKVSFVNKRDLWEANWGNQS